MKNKLIVGILCLFILVAFLIIKTDNSKTKDYKTIKIAEVTHSPFYTPLYVAIEKGYFKENNLNIELILTPGADKVATAVLANDADIGFAGPESAIYVYKGNEEDYLVTFAGLTKRDGQFIVGRNKNFTWNDLKGKEVLVGRKGGMPALNFLNALKNKGIDPSTVNINYSIDFASLSGAFIGKTGDYVNLFEPNATMIENESLGYAVESIGNASGIMPYTAFYTKKSTYENHKDMLIKFNDAINKALKYTKENDSKVIAEDIIKQFPDTKINDLEKIIKRYKESDSWLNTTFISEQMLKNLEDIMIDNKLLDEYIPYNKLIKNISNE